MKKTKSYALLDSGHQKRLERFGEYVLIRPCATALWEPQQLSLWKTADAYFTREDGNRWIFHKPLPTSWEMELKGLYFKVTPTDFGHLGIFPEHCELWEWMEKKIEQAKRPVQILNLFAYSGASTLKLARCGAKVCHLDASKKSVHWAGENAALNQLEEAPIRWIVDDAIKFLKREEKRQVHYDAILLDPPSFGKGAKGEVFKIEEDLLLLLDSCRRVLTAKPLFLVLSCHTPGYTPLVMRYLLEEIMGSQGMIEAAEMVIPGEKTRSLPLGSYARWSYE